MTKVVELCKSRVPRVHPDFCRPSECGIIRSGAGGVEMKRFIIPIVIVVAILIVLAFLTEGSAIAPFLYRNF
jgi:uncharacterized protein DUF5989